MFTLLPPPLNTPQAPLRSRNKVSETLRAEAAGAVTLHSLEPQTLSLKEVMDLSPEKHTQMHVLCDLAGGSWIP